MSVLNGRAISGYRPSLHSCAESLSLDCLDMSSAVGRECLDIPIFGRESLSPDFCDPCPDFRDQILVCPDFREPCSVFRDQILV